MRVYVTGGSGLLGSHLAAHLREEDHEVVALHRRTSDTLRLEELGCELVEGDVRDGPESLLAGMEGCSHAVHGAALVYSGGSWPKIREVNVEGTAHVLEAAARAGVGHAVQISSVAVYGPTDGPVDETAPLDTPLHPTDLYARSKREAEEEARRVEGETGVAVTVLRPSAVYGEGDRLMAPALADLLRAPVVPLLGSGRNRVPVVYSGNVATATALALRAGRGGAVFDVGMDRPLTQRELLAGLARGLGRSPRLIPTPAGLVRSGADLLQKVGVSTPGAQHLPIARVARLALAENPHPSDRIRRELDWDPPHDHESALERTGRWLKENR